MKKLKTLQSFISQLSQKQTRDRLNAFTIVELVIVVVVIAIIAGIVIVSYRGITGNAVEASMQSDLSSTKDQIVLYRLNNGRYPDSLDSSMKKQSEGNTIGYSKAGGGFCVDVISIKTTKTFYKNDNSSGEGICPPFMQQVTSSSCPSSRTRGIDARDNHTYWIQKLADNKCWMLTNLAYAGGTGNAGVSTYGDVIPTGNGSGGTLSGPDNSGTHTYTLAKYYNPTGSNLTINPIDPSTDISGGGTGKQYGYLYNFCAANGGQTGNGACNTNIVAVDSTKSICPKGWRLPTGGSGGELTLLNNSINSGSSSSDSGLRNIWLAQYAGLWQPGGFADQGVTGYFWSSTIPSAWAGNGYLLNFNGSFVLPLNDAGKTNGLSVRCVAA